MVGLCTRQGHCTGERLLSVGARPWCDAPVAASENQPAFAWHARARHCARCLLVGGAARELAARAHRAALIVAGSCTKQGHCTGVRPLSLDGAAVVRRANCCLPETESAGLRVARARACHYAGCLSGGGAARERAARACHAAVVLVGLCSINGHCTDERPLSFAARPWCDVPATATQNQPAFASHAWARHCARCLSGGGAARERAMHAPCHAGGDRSIH